MEEPTTQMRTSRRPSPCSLTPRSLVLVVQPGQPGGQSLDRHLEVRVQVHELAQPRGDPGQGDPLLAAPLLELLDPAVGEVHPRLPSPRPLSGRTPGRATPPARPRAAWTTRS